MTKLAPPAIPRDTRFMSLSPRTKRWSKKFSGCRFYIYGTSFYQWTSESLIDCNEITPPTFYSFTRWGSEEHLPTDESPVAHKTILQNVTTLTANAVIGRFRLMKINHLLIALALCLQTSFSSADFGEIDFIVRESVENYFIYEGRKVDLSTLAYEGDPKIQDHIMTIETTIMAIQGFTHDWGLHYCTTKVKMLSPGKYQDLESVCSYDTDR